MLPSQQQASPAEPPHGASGSLPPTQTQDAPSPVLGSEDNRTMGLAKDLSLQGWRFPGREQSRLLLLPGAETV